MATTPESKVKRRVRELLKEYGAFVYAPVTGGYSVSGFFDLFALYKGVPIGIEVKFDATKKPTKLQTHNAMLFFSAGGFSLLLHRDNLQVLEDILRSINDKGVGVIREIIWPADCIESCERES